VEGPAADRVAEAPKAGEWIYICGAPEHNLKHIDVDLPLNRMVVVTGGVAREKVHAYGGRSLPGAGRDQGSSGEVPGAHDAIEGYERIDDAILIDQSAIGRNHPLNPQAMAPLMPSARSLWPAGG